MNLDLAAIETRLKAIKIGGTPLFQQVLTALDPDTVIEAGAVTKDSAFVVPVRESAISNERTTGTFSQQTTTQFAVMIGIRSINDRLGQSINSRLRTAIIETRKALIGWQPDPELDPIEFNEGEIVAFLRGGAFWLEQYSTGYLFEQE